LARGKTRLSGEGAQRAGLYARVSTQDQNTLPLQMAELAEYTKRRGWSIALQEAEIGSGAKTRPQREKLMRAARRREIDVIVVWRLDRWGRSILDLIGTLNELHSAGVGFVSLNEALDLTSAAGRALAGMLAVFAEFERDILRDRVKAGIAHARAQGRPHGRPVTIQSLIPKIRELAADGVSKRQIAATLGISRTSVRRLLTQTKRSAT
jgi:putative DNA-invertase from lambdoid prophage Rac